ncbi:PREDICTED: somatostatin receptor type 2-like [Vollenhovia emeryi]|uniref:somatostatin receptor type 2-like n=1 Tax=Vollenhovia emeryi TaxID=411798 RepID=UPI0005F52353|nr:PREDICTED: somatostatin receptor type 2-like [Vollenhovia emeryi]XP_011867167.1 PREDICTED: somatostatin receptor type 2-like [Vollenhovia emeryi]XP_011867168.1 PREDICTED: somatostatin receptor type 2-like [Vollenhovia emeryi]XP_011867169.1 PREDICTED: somatostatin receptor type 2-like [Vollenhovia emeryi]XP_011867170.1 PREDICTED: somatostatin receptor type 2-like [Vollenhovia emeryi]XP_011867171.1 PREDICTED: somatostatin receptor type 2-like [Vollenhovia emeryi]XP_011867172.1 PREDICTED: som
MDYDNLTNLMDNNTVVHCVVDLSIIGLVNQILYFIVFIVGIFGNSLVIYVISRFSSMQTVTNMYIVNLAIADECFLIGIPFLVTTMILHNWVFGKFMCKAYMTTTTINQFTSSLFLLIMSADRYVAVCHPISSSKIRTPLISKIVSFTAWATSILFMIPVFRYADTMEYSNGHASCNIFWPNDRGGQTAFILYSFILGFVLPLIFILNFYFLVIKKLRTVGPQNKSKERKRHRKVTRLVLTVITVYIFCWLPYWVTQLALIFTPPRQCQTSMSIASFLLAGFLSYSNSAMNPILYAFLSDNFKKSFLKACACITGKSMNQYINENSIFLRRNRGNTDGLQSNPGHSRLELDDEEGERGLLFSKTSTTAVTMTSRSNITISSESKDVAQKKNILTKRGVQLTLTTQV